MIQAFKIQIRARGLCESSSSLYKKSQTEGLQATGSVRNTKELFSYQSHEGLELPTSHSH